MLSDDCCYIKQIYSDLLSLISCASFPLPPDTGIIRTDNSRLCVFCLSFLFSLHICRSYSKPRVSIRSLEIETLVGINLYLSKHGSFRMHALLAALCFALTLKTSVSCRWFSGVLMCAVSVILGAASFTSNNNSKQPIASLAVLFSGAGQYGELCRKTISSCKRLLWAALLINEHHCFMVNFGASV